MELKENLLNLDKVIDAAKEEFEISELQEITAPAALALAGGLGD